MKENLKINGEIAGSRVQAPLIVEYGGDGPDLPEDRALSRSGTCRTLFEFDD